LNIQSELQDIDNMGTAAIRGGADPNMAYIAGLDAKQKAFQSKQNYDAQSRSQADMANAQMSMQADQFNAQAFDRVYNNLVGQARDAQSAEKQAAVASLTNKKAKFVQDENLKAMGIPLVAPGFNVTSEGKITLPEDARAMFEFYNYMKEQESKTAPKTTAKKGMYKK
jgi:multidrug efflux pump subunit AcrA (membrane-fusion protein)